MRLSARVLDSAKKRGYEPIFDESEGSVNRP
jgi:hypothetical protein